MRHLMAIVEGIGEWKNTLDNNVEIAQYIEAVSPDEVDVDNLEDIYRGKCAVLRYVPIANISPNPASDNHEEVPERMDGYRSLDPVTMPPLLTEFGLIEDGHHRYRIALEKGLTHVWCYEVTDDEWGDEDPLEDPMAH